jgi:hypothetical protein
MASRGARQLRFRLLSRLRQEWEERRRKCNTAGGAPGSVAGGFKSIFKFRRASRRAVPFPLLLT